MPNNRCSRCGGNLVPDDGEIKCLLCGRPAVKPKKPRGWRDLLKEVNKEKVPVNR